MIEILLDPFRYDFMIRSLITAFASGAMLSLLGPFTINRNMGFMADAMAHATLPIIAVGVFLGFSISELGVPAAILIAIFLGLIIKNTNVGEDTAIGIIFSSFFALGFVLISLLNVTINLEDLLFGQILAVNISDVYIVVSLLILVILVTVIYFKQLLFYSFDPIGAEVKGLNTTFLNYLFLILLSGFFSSSETALTAVSEARIHELALQGNKKAITIERILAKKEKKCVTFCPILSQI